MATNGVDFNEIRRRVFALRKAELHECLERLGMRKGGNKPELQQRLLDIFEDSCNLVNNGYAPPRDMWRITAAQRIIEDVYNKQALGGANGWYTHAAAGDDTKSRGGGAGGSAPTGAAQYTNGEAAGAAAGAAGAAPTADMLLAGAMTAFLRERAAGGGAAGGPPVIRCSCGSTSDRQPQVQCRVCGVWQHRHCVGLDASGGKPAGGDDFYCELCRAKRADPFWAVEDAGITPALRLSSTGKQTAVNGTMQAVRSAERTFNLSQQQLQKVKSRQADHQLQLACLMMNDAVPFRFHWPLSADLRVNSVQYRVYSRNSTQKLGTNARDEPANIGQLWNGGAPGRFNLVMQCADNAAYVMLVLLVRRRSPEEVRRLMAPQLSLRDSVDRVKHLLARDDDDEVQTGATVVSLRCPILGTRVHTPARFSEVRGLACFDLGAFLDSAARTRKWQCPISMTHTTVHSLQIDTYMQRIISALANYPSVMEVEVEADGSWRPAGWKGRFYSVEEDNPLVAGAGPGADGAGASGAGGAAGGRSDDDDEEEDEEEELRRAAAAVSAAAGQKRKRPPSPDVIDLASSDDDDDGGGGGAAAGPPAAAAHPTSGLNGGGAAGARPAAAPGGQPRRTGSARVGPRRRHLPLEAVPYLCGSRCRFDGW